MRVALLGNMNNNHFNLARYLRDRGVDAQVFMFDKDHSHFHPSNDSLDASFEDFIHRLDWGPSKSFYNTHKRDILAVIDGFDAVFGCGAAPAYLAKANRRLDLFLHYGEDLYGLPFYSLGGGRSLRQKVRRYMLSRCQRRGIETARFIATQSIITDEAWIRARFNLAGEVVSGMYPILYDYVDDTASSPQILEDPDVQTFEGLRQRSDFLVYHPTRHLWHDPEDEWMWKRNDVTIRAFARFLSVPATPQSAMLVMNEYGKDVEHSKALVESLGIGGKVAWLPVMSRKHILYMLARSDLAVSQFGAKAFMSGTIQEMLASGTPMLNFGWPEDENMPAAWLYPYLHAENVEQASAAMVRCWKEPQDARSQAERARQWWRSAAQDSVDKYMAIAQTANGGSGCGLFSAKQGVS